MIEGIIQSIKWWEEINFYSSIIEIISAAILAYSSYKVNYSEKKSSPSKKWHRIILIFAFVVVGQELLSLYSSNKISSLKAKKDIIESSNRDYLFNKDRYPIQDFSFNLKYTIKYLEDSSPLRGLSSFSKYTKSDFSQIEWENFKLAKEHFKDYFQLQNITLFICSQKTKPDNCYELVLERTINLMHYIEDDGKLSRPDEHLSISFSENHFVVKLLNYKLNFKIENSEITSLLDLKNKNVFFYIRNPYIEKYQLTIDKLQITNGPYTLYELTEFKEVNNSDLNLLKPRNIDFIFDSFEN